MALVGLAASSLLQLSEQGQGLMEDPYLSARLTLGALRASIGPDLHSEDTKAVWQIKNTDERLSTQLFIERLMSMPKPVFCSATLDTGGIVVLFQALDPDHQEWSESVMSSSVRSFVGIMQSQAGPHFENAGVFVTGGGLAEVVPARSYIAWLRDYLVEGVGRAVDLPKRDNDDLRISLIVRLARTPELEGTVEVSP